MVLWGYKEWEYRQGSVVRVYWLGWALAVISGVEGKDVQTGEYRQGFALAVVSRHLTTLPRSSNVVSKVSPIRL